MRAYLVLGLGATWLSASRKIEERKTFFSLSPSCLVFQTRGSRSPVTTYNFTVLREEDVLI